MASARPCRSIDGFWVIPPNTPAAAASASSPAIPCRPGRECEHDDSVQSQYERDPHASEVALRAEGRHGGRPPRPGATGTTATITPATTGNPIVGRIAYWTDDETSKVNINTASEGAFTDTPRTDGASDFSYAAFPTAQNEIQRYPGHPAMTCLSTVLGSLYPVDHTLPPPSVGAYYAAPSPATTYAPYQPYYDIAPKLNVDTGTNLGSQAGTVLTYNSSSGSGTPTALVRKTDRLYDSVDELMFASNLLNDNDHTQSPLRREQETPAPSPNPRLRGPPRSIKRSGKSQILSHCDSRAPDVNLFNQPRILTWPLNANTTSAYRTPFRSSDCLLRNAQRFALLFSAPAQRPSHERPTGKLFRRRYRAGPEPRAYRYLQTLTSPSNPIPGFGGSFYAKYPRGSDEFDEHGDVAKRARPDPDRNL